MTRIVTSKNRWFALAVLGGIPTLGAANTLPVAWDCQGTCGTDAGSGVVVAAPSGAEYFGWISTADSSVFGVGLPGVIGPNGTRLRSTPFRARAGDVLDFNFNFVTSDGGGFADYAWARLLDTFGNPVAMLFNVRTSSFGPVMPGLGLPPIDATLDLSGVVFRWGGPVWSVLGSDSGRCFSRGCGYTGWIPSRYTIPEAGDYVLELGVVNWSDTQFQSALAFDTAVLRGGVNSGGADYQNIELTAWVSNAAGTLLADSFSQEPDSVLALPQQTALTWRLPPLSSAALTELEFSLELPEPRPGSTLPLLDRLLLTYTDQDGVAQQRELGPVTVDVLASAISLELAVTGSRIAVGEPVTFSLNVENRGAAAALAALEVSIQDAGGSEVHRLLVDSGVSLTPGEQQQIVLPELVTAGLYAGRYQVLAKLHDFGTQARVTASADFELTVPAGLGIAARLTTDQPVYQPRANVDLWLQIENQTLAQALQNHQLEFTVRDPQGAVFWSETRGLPQIPAGGFTEVLARFALTDELPGRYQASVLVRDGQGDVAATASTRFDVRSVQETGAGLVGRLVATPNPVLVGETVSILATVESDAGVPLEAVPISLILLDPAARNTGTAVEIQRWTWEHDFAPGTVHEIEVTAGIPPEARGHWLAVLSTELGDSSQVLAQTSVNLRERFTLDANISGPGRVLVLVDPPHSNECTGVRRVELDVRSGWLGSAADAEWVIELLDDAGGLLDREVVVVGVDDWVDLQSGPLVNLAVTSVSEQGLRLELVPGDSLGGANGVLPKSPMQIRVGNSGPLAVAALLSPWLSADCNLDRQSWSTPTEFVLYGVDWATSGQFGLKRRLIEEVLGDSGWSFRLVDTAEAFADGLRHDGYSNFLLLASRVKLPNLTSRELREAVFTGSGIVMAGTQDHRNHELFEMFGTNPVGVHAQALGVIPLPAAGPLNLDSLFAVEEKPLALRLVGAQPVAEYRLSGGRPADRTAVARATYGSGLAIFVGFDLLAQATEQGRYGPFAQFLTQALAAVQPAWNELRPGLAVPITWEIANAGDQVTIQHEVELLDGRIADAGPAQPNGFAALNHRMQLRALETQSWRFWWRVPPTGTEAAMVSWLDRIDGPSRIPYLRATHRFPLVQAPDWLTVQQSISSMAAANPAWSALLEPFDRAQRATTEQRWSDARTGLLDAAQWLANEGSAQAGQVRRDLGWLLFAIGAKD